VTPGFTHSHEELEFRGRIVSAGVASYVGPDGAVFERDIVHHPGAVSVVAVRDHDGDPVAILVRQFRGATGGMLLEIPAGTRDVDGEPPEETARRELAEEVGVRAEHLELLATFYNSPGFCDEYSYVYLALGLSAVPTSLQGVEEQHMTTEEVRLADVPARIQSGYIVDAKSSIGLLLARERLGASG
jgi:ADP-ribose pyrophosphatase